MFKLRFLAATTAVFVLAAAPAVAQAGGNLGSSAAQGTSESRQPDQTFEDMRNNGVLNNHAKPPSTDELVIGSELVKEQKYAEAVPHLENALAKHPRNLTALIYLGFSHRMIGGGLTGEARNAEFQKALDYYRQGLAIDSHNKLLHEYAGKVFILLHDAQSAETEQTALKRLCPDGCDELTALTEALNLYQANEALRQPAPAKP